MREGDETPRAGESGRPELFEPVVREDVLRVRRPGTRWLSTGPDGGQSRGSVAYNVSVPEGWEHTDLGAYVAERRARAGFDEPGPALFTGVDLDHLRGARAGSVEAYATAGVSNPAALPMEVEGSTPAGASTPTASSRVGADGRSAGKRDGDRLAGRADTERGTDAEPGTVNLVVGTDHALAAGALANLIAVVAEAKAATLLAATGVPGTTTDAVIVGCDPDGEPAAFSGSATSVGAAARACVREAVCASLASRYADRTIPASVAAAEHGVRTTGRATVFSVDRRGADRTTDGRDDRNIDDRRGRTADDHD
jgi:adenosylcobinamide hydrolase